MADADPQGEATGDLAGRSQVPSARIASPLAAHRGERILRRASSRRVAALAAAALCALLPGARPAGAQPSPSPGASVAGPATASTDGLLPAQTVLLLYADPRLTPATVSVDQAVRATIDGKARGPIIFYTEFLDLNLLDGPVPQRELYALLRRKYESRSIDLIIAAGSRALRVALRNRADLFSGAPIVFVAVDRAAIADLRLDGDVSGTWLHQGWTETLELARRLQPQTQRAVVVSGASPNSRVWRQAAQAQLEVPGAPITVSHLAGLKLEEVLERVAALSDHTVILTGPFERDAAGREFRGGEAITRISAASRVPTYGLAESHVAAGAVGGYVPSWEGHGRVAGELALRILAGERPAPRDAGTMTFTVNARELARWKLDPRRLPAGSVVLFRETSAWERHRAVVVGALGLLVVQGALIAGLLVQRVRRRRAQERLAERLRFETLLSNLSAALATCPAAGVDQEIHTGLARIVEDLDVDQAGVWAAGPGGEGFRLTHSSMRAGAPPLPPLIRESEAPLVFARLREARLVRIPSAEHPPGRAQMDGAGLAAIGAGSVAIVPFITGGEIAGGLSVAAVRAEHRWPDEIVPRLRLLADVFANALARQHAEQAEHVSAAHIRDLAGRLMTAQEEERRRIAGDLHDDVSQDLAALSIALSALGKEIEGDRPELVREVARLHERTVGAANAVRLLSHELHPGVLQYAGLGAALRSYCRNFEREHGLAVTFWASDDLAALAPSAALCLYRVTQEALGNVARHAHAREVRVTLEREGGDVVLTIVDDGTGFDLPAARARGGLGLISLDERVRLARGRLMIDTKPQGGTALRVVVPLSEET